MPSTIQSVLIAFRCLGAPTNELYSALREIASDLGEVAPQTAVLGDAGDSGECDWPGLARLADHLLLHKAPQGLGPTNRLAIAQARILNVDALVIIDGDGVYAEPVEAVRAVIRALESLNVVVAQQSVVSLPVAGERGHNRALYEHFERWLLERRFECDLPRQLQPGLYALDRDAIGSISLECRHFAADWEIAYRTLASGMSLGPTPTEATTREQPTTSFKIRHQRDKLREIFNILRCSRDAVDGLLDEFQQQRGQGYERKHLQQLRRLASGTRAEN